MKIAQTFFIVLCAVFFYSKSMAQSVAHQKIPADDLGICVGMIQYKFAFQNPRPSQIEIKFLKDNIKRIGLYEESIKTKKKQCQSVGDGDNFVRCMKEKLNPDTFSFFFKQETVVIHIQNDPKFNLSAIESMCFNIIK
jgi:hypothetical protein